MPEQRNFLWNFFVKDKLFQRLKKFFGLCIYLSNSRNFIIFVNPGKLNNKMTANRAFFQHIKFTHPESFPWHKSIRTRLTQASAAMYISHTQNLIFPRARQTALPSKGLSLNRLHIQYNVFQK